MTPTSIETMSGRFVDLVNPDPTTICVNDIAWALSRMPRYVGHTVSAIPYTIGQHSIFVTDLVSKLFSKKCEDSLMESFYNFVNEKYSTELVGTAASLLLDGKMSSALALELLMHDASEAYIVDVPTPLKRSDGFREVYLKLEDQMMSAIRAGLNMGEADPVHELFVSWADAAALTIEAYHLIASRGANWSRLLPLDRISLQIFESPQPSIDTYREFLSYYEDLKRL